MLTEQTPLWDEAISSMLAEEQQMLDAPLGLEKLQELGVTHTIRVGDILETLFLMAIYGDWLYLGADGRQKELDEEALQSMYAAGRIDKDNASAFAGEWVPAGYFPRG